MAKTKAQRCLKGLRKQAKLTIEMTSKFTEQLAKTLSNPHLGVSPRMLSDFEYGKRLPQVHQVHALAIAYGCSVRDILSCYNIPVDPTDRLLAAWRKTRAEAR